MHRLSNISVVRFSFVVCRLCKPCCLLVLIPTYNTLMVLAAPFVQRYLLRMKQNAAWMPVLHWSDCTALSHQNDLVLEDIANAAS